MRTFIKKNGQNIMHIQDRIKTLDNINDILEMIGDSLAHSCNNIIANDNSFAHDFFNPETNLAQVSSERFKKFSVRLALIIEDKDKYSKEFKSIIDDQEEEYIKVFFDYSDGMKWLLEK